MKPRLRLSLSDGGQICLLFGDAFRELHLRPGTLSAGCQCGLVGECVRLTWADRGMATDGANVYEPDVQKNVL
jgi:hypothetical protein